MMKNNIKQFQILFMAKKLKINIKIKKEYFVEAFNFII